MDEIEEVQSYQFIDRIAQFWEKYHTTGNYAGEFVVEFSQLRSDFMTLNAQEKQDVFIYMLGQGNPLAD